MQAMNFILGVQKMFVLQYFVGTMIGLGHLTHGKSCKDVGQTWKIIEKIQNIVFHVPISSSNGDLVFISVFT